MPIPASLPQGALWSSAILSACVLCGCPARVCQRTGANGVGGVATATAAPEQCSGEISGDVDDTSGSAVVAVVCTPPHAADPQQTSSSTFDISLPDPRTLDVTSRVAATEQDSMRSKDGSSFVGISGPVTATLRVVESAGETAPLPQAVTDDFLRHVVVHLSDTDVSDVDVDITIRAADLRQPQFTCDD
jgi:hypothetical protein